MLLLNEHAQSDPVELSPAQQQGLRKWFDAKLLPTTNGKTIVVPSNNHVGAVRIDGLDVVVRPKLPVTKLLSIIAEAADPYRWAGLDVSGLQSDSLPDGVSALFAQACLVTFEQGVLQAYRRENQTLPYVRGRLRLAEYARTPMPLPIPVRTGVFDSNNLENQVLRAALHRVRTSRTISERTRSVAQRAWKSVAHTDELRDPLMASSKLAWNRRNRYYLGAVSLARMILAAGSGGNLSEGASTHEIPGFVINIPYVVEQWVRVHLRKHWGFDALEMRDNWSGKLWLDDERSVELIPDLAVRVHGDWRFIGDVKYKDFTKGGPRHSDLYQLVSYLTATGVRTGTLIYAGTAGDEVSLNLPVSGMNIDVITVDLSAADPAAELIAKVPRPRLI